MDSNVHDNTVPMEEAVTEEPTSSASGGSKSRATPEANTSSTPVEKQAGDESGFVYPKRKKRKDKLPAEKSADAALPKLLPMEATDPSLIPKSSFFKRPTGGDPNCVHLWNAGGRRSNKKAPKELVPKIVVVDMTPIYIQNLTAAQAVASGVVGWDVVLADVAVMHADAVENRIATFWADWKRKLRQFKSDAAKQRLLTRADAPSKSTPPNFSATIGTGEKRKCGDTPLSNQPAGKSTKNYSGAAKRGTKHAKKDHEEILWVHSTEEEKGPVSESIFFYVVSQCNKIKIDAINNDDATHTWSPGIKGQPVYDDVNHRGKIICSNQQTVDFWVKYIELASTQVGKIKLKAWTSKEYETRNAIYSCLIPKKTCIGISTKAIVQACLTMYTIKNSEGVVRCHTSYTVKDQQRICILEVTDKLSSFFEFHGRVLSGPFVQLTFKRRSDDNSEKPSECETVEDENVSTAAPVPSVPVLHLGRAPVPPVPVLHLGRAREGSEPVTLGSSIPESEMDSILQSPQMSSKTFTNRTFSDTDSVKLYIGPNFKKLGTNPTLSDAEDAFPPLPSQKLLE